MAGINEITWAGGQNLTCTATANSQEWSIDLTPGSYTGTYWHVWSTGKNSILRCFADNANVDVPNGNFSCTNTITGGTVTATSDIRKKDGITPYVADLSSLKAYKYFFKNDEKKTNHVGLIAQEVEKVCPEAISETQDGTKTLDYNAVVALLVNKVNEMQKEIDKLKQHAK